MKTADSNEKPDRDDVDKARRRGARFAVNYPNTTHAPVPHKGKGLDRALEIAETLEKTSSKNLEPFNPKGKRIKRLRTVSLPSLFEEWSRAVQHITQAASTVASEEIKRTRRRTRRFLSRQYNRAVHLVDPMAAKAFQPGEIVVDTLTGSAGRIGIVEKSRPRNGYKALQIEDLQNSFRHFHRRFKRNLDPISETFIFKDSDINPDYVYKMPDAGGYVRLLKGAGIFLEAERVEPKPNYTGKESFQPTGERIFLFNTHAFKTRSYLPFPGRETHAVVHQSNAEMIDFAVRDTHGKVERYVALPKASALTLYSLHPAWAAKHWNDWDEHYEY